MMSLVAKFLGQTGFLAKAIAIHMPSDLRRKNQSFSFLATVSLE
jgi:hypothetical protein